MVAIRSYFLFQATYTDSVILSCRSCEQTLNSTPSSGHWKKQMISVTPQFSHLSSEQHAPQIEAPIRTPLVMKAQARRQLVSESKVAAASLAGAAAVKKSPPSVLPQTAATAADVLCQVLCCGHASFSPLQFFLTCHSCILFVLCFRVLSILPRA